MKTIKARILDWMLIVAVLTLIATVVGVVLSRRDNKSDIKRWVNEYFHSGYRANETPQSGSTVELDFNYRRIRTASFYMIGGDIYMGMYQKYGHTGTYYTVS